MSSTVLLNSVEHKDLKINTKFGAGLGDNIWYTPTFPLEFRSIQAHYPIFFQKNPKTGRFIALALMGLQDNENLFIQNNTWNAGYIPLTIKRQPFLIGMQNIIEDGLQKQQRVIHIDLESPRVSKMEGQDLFMEFGANTPYLDQVADMLETIHHGLKTNDDFVQKLVEYDLLETFTLDIELNDGSRNSMLGFYTIHEENLRTLNSDAMTKLHELGYLESIYMVMASQSNVRHLVDLKNKGVSKSA